MEKCDCPFCDEEKLKKVHEISQSLISAAESGKEDMEVEAHAHFASAVAMLKTMKYSENDIMFTCHKMITNVAIINEKVLH